MLGFKCVYHQNVIMLLKGETRWFYPSREPLMMSQSASASLLFCEELKVSPGFGCQPVSSTQEGEEDVIALKKLPSGLFHQCFSRK